MGRAGGPDPCWQCWEGKLEVACGQCAVLLISLIDTLWELQDHPRSEVAGGSGGGDEGDGHEGDGEGLHG